MCSYLMFEIKCFLSLKKLVFPFLDKSAFQKGEGGCLTDLYFLGGWGGGGGAEVKRWEVNI